MKLIAALICAALCGSAALAESSVIVTVETRTPGPPIPRDFTGLSFGMKALPGNKNGEHLFSPTNTALVALFQNLGLRHLRVGGTTVESPPQTPIPGETDIDSLFAFARAAGVNRIIYSLRLLETDPAVSYVATNVAIAKYIWSHYRAGLDCFSLGNEPDRGSIYEKDVTITNFPSYLRKWRKFATAITDALPGARFGGPDAGSGNISWTTRFARAEKKAGIVSVVTEHYYPGGKGKGIEAPEGIETMLSAEWLKNYETLYEKMAAVVLSNGLSFRFTEANDHYSGGIPDASDTFAGALWALDYLHWWAAHDAQGVDFHNTQWVSSDIIAPDADGQLNIKPKAYGLKAFDLGSHGRVEPVAISNAADMNLTAYAVGGDGNLYVTIINKEHAAGAKDVNVTILAEGISKRADVIYLTAQHGDVTAKSGVTLGGTVISNSAPWTGKWTRLSSKKKGQCIVKVPAASAAVVRVAISSPAPL